MKMSHPEKYWHCYVQLLGGAERAYANDLSLDELQRQIVDSWRHDRSFNIDGQIVPGRENVEKIKVTHTPQPSQHYVDRQRSKELAEGLSGVIWEPGWYAISEGVDHTHEFLFANLELVAPAPEIALILQLCKRLPAAARILATRRKGKRPLKVKDEYDAQDLLHAVLRAYLKYTVHEEPLGKVGGAHFGRADVAIEELGAVVELKYAHGPDDQKRIVDEFANDLLLYTKWPHLKNFIYLVYNSQDLRDPEAMEKLARKQTVNGITFTVYVVLA
jgi:hypothetical protein